MSALEDGSMAAGEPVESKQLDEFKKQFAIPTGYDHPNEVAAHTSGYLLRTDYLLQEAGTTELSEDLAGKTRAAFKRIFAIVGD